MVLAHQIQPLPPSDEGVQDRQHVGVLRQRVVRVELTGRIRRLHRLLFEGAVCRAHSHVDLTVRSLGQGAAQHLVPGGPGAIRNDLPRHAGARTNTMPRVWAWRRPRVWARRRRFRAAGELLVLAATCQGAAERAAGELLVLVASCWRAAERAAREPLMMTKGLRVLGSRALGHKPPLWGTEMAARQAASDNVYVSVVLFAALGAGSRGRFGAIRSPLAGECRDAAPPFGADSVGGGVPRRCSPRTHCPKHLVQRWGPAERCPELGGLLLDAPAWALQVLLDRSRGRASDQATPRRQAERVHVERLRVHVERLRNLAERAIVEHTREGVAVGAHGSEVRPTQGA